MPETCGEPHPDRPEVTCEKPKPHYYQHVSYTHQIDWEGQDPPPGPPPRSTRKARAAEMAQGVDPAPTTGPPDPHSHSKPTVFFAKSDGPVNSKTAIEEYDPYRETARGRVLWHLYDNLGCWVNAGVLEAPEIGGRAGTRRMRELREQGFLIETRLVPGSKTQWQHRLLLEPTQDWD